MIHKGNLFKGAILIDKVSGKQTTVLETKETERGCFRGFYSLIEDKTQRLHGYTEYCLTDVRKYFRLPA